MFIFFASAGGISGDELVVFIGAFAASLEECGESAFATLSAGGVVGSLLGVGMVSMVLIGVIALAKEPSEGCFLYELTHFS